MGQLDLFDDDLVDHHVYEVKVTYRVPTEETVYVVASDEEDAVIEAWKQAGNLDHRDGDEEVRLLDPNNSADREVIDTAICMLTQS